MWVVSFVPCNRSWFQNFAEDDCWLFLCSLEIFCNFFQGLLVPLGDVTNNVIFKMACANVIRKVQESDRPLCCCLCLFLVVRACTHACRENSSQRFWLSFLAAAVWTLVAVEDGKGRIEEHNVSEHEPKQLTWRHSWMVSEHVIDWTGLASLSRRQETNGRPRLQMMYGLTCFPSSGAT